jgi:hypothetical protein
MENKGSGTGDLTLALSCRNIGNPVALVIHLTKGDGAPVQSAIGDYRDSSGNVLIHERASCVDKDGAKPTIVHIPAAIFPAQDRRLKAQVEILGPGDELLERSKVFDVHFPKTDSKSTTVIAKVRVEPELRDAPGAEQADQYKVADAIAPVAIEPQRPITVAPLIATRIERPNAEAKEGPIATRTGHADVVAGAIPVAFRAGLPKTGRPSNTAANESLGVLASALDDSGRLANWTNSLAPTGAVTWWQASPPAEPTLKMSVSRAGVFFPIEPLDTESLPANIRITNNTQAAVTISAPTISGNDPSDFTQTNDCGRTLDTGTTCTLSLTFRPTASGTRTALLAVEGTTQKITVTGIGK